MTFNGPAGGDRYGVVASYIESSSVDKGGVLAAKVWSGSVGIIQEVDTNATIN